MSLPSHIPPRAADSPLQLWCHPDRVARVLAAVRAGEPTAVAIASLVRSQPPDTVNPENPGDALELDALRCLLDHDRDAAHRAGERLAGFVRPEVRKNLSLSYQALLAAVVVDCCSGGWPSELLASTSLRLAQLYDALQAVERHEGNPHHVVNNHWAVTLSASAMTLLALARLEQLRRPGLCLADVTMSGRPLPELLEFQSGRVAAFVAQHGEHGMYHEGPGYLAYPAAYWMPASLACLAATGRDPLAGITGVANIALALYSMSLPTWPDDADNSGDRRFGSRLSWNDDGDGWIHSSVSTLAIHLAEPRYRGALRTLFDRLCGIDADQPTFAPDFCGRFFTLLFYPYDHPPQNPDTHLPHRWTDHRHGWNVFRNRYQNRDDAVFGAYARVCHPGGHAHDDAGSIRFAALGHHWIVGGGQARPDARWQSVLRPSLADNGDVKPKPGNGAVLWDTADANASVFGIELRRASGAYHERYLAVHYPDHPDIAAVLAVLDLVDDHLHRDWDWHLTLGPALTCHLSPGGFAFVPQDPASPARLYGTFLATPPANVRQIHTPASSRHFQSGVSRAYPPRPVLCAQFANTPHLAAYAVLVVCRGGHTALQPPTHQAPTRPSPNPQHPTHQHTTHQHPGSQLPPLAAPIVRPTGGIGFAVGPLTFPRPFLGAVPPWFEPGKTGILARYPSATP